MKRTTTALSAFAAAAALLLAGCGSDTAGNATPAAPASSAAAPTAMSDTSEVASSDAATSDAATSDAATSDAATSDAATSDAATSDAATSDTSEAPTTDETSSSDETSSADTAPTTTVGSGGDLDATSVKWFDTYCSGLAPAFDKIKNIQKDMSSAGGDPKKLMKNLSTTFTSMGEAFTGTAKSLEGVPAPTFDGGDTVATTVNKALKEFGPKFTDLGKQLATADPTDPESMKKLQNLGEDLKGVQDLGKFAVDPQTTAAIKEIPSCKPLFSLGS